MKFLIVIILVLATTSAAMADTTYKCDWYDVNSADQSTGGGNYSVVVKTDGGAEVISIPQNPMAKPYVAYELNIFSQDMNSRIMTTNKVQDVNVVFTKSSDEKAGVLRIQETMPMPNGKISPAQEYICTK